MTENIYIYIYIYIYILYIYIYIYIYLVNDFCPLYFQLAGSVSGGNVPLCSGVFQLLLSVFELKLLHFQKLFWQIAAISHPFPKHLFSAANPKFLGLLTPK